MPTDRAQDTEAIRAALDASYHIAECGEHPEHLLAAENAARKAAPALARLVARLEAAEQERDEAKRELVIVERVSQRNANAHMDAERRVRAALAAAAPGETEQTP